MSSTGKNRPTTNLKREIATEVVKQTVHRTHKKDTLTNRTNPKQLAEFKHLNTKVVKSFEK